MKQSDTQELIELSLIVDEIRAARNPNPKQRKPRRKSASQTQMEADIATAQKILAERKLAANPPLDLKIFSDAPPITTKRILESVIDGRGWRDAALTQRERDAAALAAEQERTGMIQIPEPEWGE